MARQPRVLGMVLAGGEGKRLWPLTADRAKPAVPFGGQLPAHRLRAVQPGERRLPAHLRADPVQVALAGPPHHPDLADVDGAGQLRHAGAGPAAPRPALVHRQRRRDPAVVEPDLRRQARLHHRVRRRPRVPDGPAPDGPAAHRFRCRGHRRGHPGAAGRGHRVRRDRRRPRTARSAASWRSRPTRPACRTAPTSLRLDGQLRVHHRGPARCAARRRRGRGLGARHGRQHHPDDGGEGDGLRLRLQRQRRARARRTATAATGATSGPWTPTTTRTWTWSPCTRSSTCTTSEWPIYTYHPHLPSAKFVEGGMAQESMVGSGTIVAGATVRHSVVAAQRPLRGPAPTSRARCSWTACRSGAERWCAARSWTRTSWCPMARTSAWTRNWTRRATTSSERRDRGVGQEPTRAALTSRPAHR